MQYIHRTLVACFTLVPIACEPPSDSDGSVHGFIGGVFDDEQTRMLLDNDRLAIVGVDRAGAEACDGSLAFTDAYVAAVGEHLGFEPGAHVDYAWLSDAIYEARCLKQPCVEPGQVRSNDLPDMAQIARAVISANQVQCPAILEEGLVQLLSGPEYRDLDADHVLMIDAAIEALLVADSIDIADYERAGHFVASLAERHGLERVIALCDALGQHPIIDDWQLASLEVLGQGLDELEADYAAYPASSTQQYRARLLECDGDFDYDYTIRAGKNTSFSVFMGCDQPEAIGPIDGKVLVSRRFLVPESVIAKVSVNNAAGELLDDVMMSQHCAPGSAIPQVNGNDHPTEWFDLDAGLHVVWFSLPVGQDDRYSVGIEATVPFGP